MPRPITFSLSCESALGQNAADRSGDASEAVTRAEATRTLVAWRARQSPTDQALLATLTGERSVTDLAKEMDVDPKTIFRWRARLLATASRALAGVAP